jgi:D-psicose/D-tagatose/L-ribulose 3-epimerase
MRIGCCGSMISPQQDPSGIEVVEDLANLGFDYIELSIRDLLKLAKPEVAQLKNRIQATGIGCESCNNFFPASVRLTGPDAQLPTAVEYATRTFERMAEFGASVVVFGSSDAKNVPAGFSTEEAWRQITGLLQQLGPVAAEFNVTIVIEPLNRRESNLVCTAAEGLKLVRDVAHPNVQLLIDYYHLKAELEDPQIVLEAGDAIRHVHFAEPTKRVFPLHADRAYDAFFRNLRQIGYQGRCSVEAYTQDFVSDARQALAVMRTATSGI